MSTTQFTTDELKDLDDEVTLPLYVLLPLGALGLYSLAFPWLFPGPLTRCRFT
ncbi:MAG: hypothetical protein WAO83_17820 [Fuerstiella sp.]